MALVLDKAHGTQTATIGTEHTLDTEAAGGVYTLQVNLKNMVNGDELELRAYTKTLTGDANGAMIYSANFANIQGDAAAPGSSAKGDVVAVSIPVVSAFSVVFTLKQTLGTGRSFDWRVDQLN